MPGLYDDLHFDNGPYVPQYAGAPLKEIQDTASELATRHYSNIAGLTQLGQYAHMLESKLLPGAKGYAKEQIGAIENALNELSRSGAENAGPAINTMAYNLNSDEKLMAGIQGAEAYKEFKKTRDQMTANGLDPIWKGKGTDKDPEQAFLNASLIDSKTGKLHDLYSKPFDLRPERTLNYLEKQNKVLDNLKPETYETDLNKAWEMARAKGVHGAEFLESTTVKALTADKVKNFINKQGGWELYKDTPEYKQQSEIQGLKDDQIKAELISVGMSKVFTDMQKQFVKNPFTNNGKGTGEGDLPLSYDRGLTIKRKTGQARNKFSFSEAMSANALGPEGTTTSMLLTGENPGVYIKPSDTPQFSADLKVAAEIAGVPVPAKDSKEAEKLLDEYDKEVGIRLSNTALVQVGQLDPKAMKTIDETVQRGWTNLDYADGQGNKIIAFKNGVPTKEFITLTGGNPDKFVATHLLDSKNAIGPLDDAGFSRPIKVSSVDKDGKPHYFYVSNPGMSNPIDNNEKIIYTRTTNDLGHNVDIGRGIKAKSLAGKQKDAVNNNILTHDMPGGPKDLLVDFADAKPEVIATLKQTDPDFNPEHLYPFNSYRELAEKLSKAGISL